MSLLLGQRKHANAPPKRGAQKRTTREELAHVAGVPLLLRLPDLVDGSRARSPSTERKAAPEVKTSEPSSSAARSTDSVVASATGGNEHRNVPQSSAGKTVWRNFTWQLLVLILLPVLFLAAWFVLSSPSSDSTAPGKEGDLASPEIELGEPVPPDALVSPDNHPAEPEADAQVQKPAKSGPPLVAAPKWTSGNDVADASAAPRDDSPVVPPPQPPPRPPSARPPDSSGGFQPQGNAPLGGGPPQVPSEPAAAPRYPTTDPATYSYPDTSDAGAAQPPAAGGGYSYPTTGAAPLFGEGPIAPAGAMPR